MKIILYMDITANGMIGKADGNSDFTSEADGKSFNAICQKVGVVISGRKTYEVLYPNYPPLKTGIHWVLTSGLTKKCSNPVVKFTDKAPEELVAGLEKSGIKEAVLIGGSQTVSEFMQKGLVDEIYLDIESLLFGQGMPLFKPADFEVHLELLEVKNLSPQTLQLHYRIKK